MSHTKVLLVEDDSNWLKIFHILIGDKTKDLFAYTSVDTLAAAFAALEREDYELIILDLMLPDSQAVNTIATMTAKIKHIPIVIITTLDDENLMQTAFEQGVEDYLVKDQYDLETFIHVVRQAIRRFIGRQTGSIQGNLSKIIEKLQLLDDKLQVLEN